MNLEVLIDADVFQNVGVSLCFIAEGVVKSAEYSLHIGFLKQQFLHERHRVHLHNFFGKWNVDHVVHAQGFDDLRLFVLVENVFHRRGALDQVARVIRKGKPRGLQAFFLRVGNGFSDQLLMPQMHTIEVSDGDRGRLDFCNLIQTSIYNHAHAAPPTAAAGRISFPA